MENNGYMTSGDLALWEQHRNDGKRHHYGANATAIALGSSGLGIAIFGGVAIAYGLNAASKARARGNEQAINQQNKTMEVLATIVNREATRSDGVTIDVNQTLRSLAAQTATANALAQGGSSTSSALAQAEALALLNQNSSANPLSNAIQSCGCLRVQRVAMQNCGCDSCGS